MFGTLLTVTGVLVAGLTGLLLLFLLGMRAKVGPVQRLVIAISKLQNPMQMRTAGTPGAYASIVRHVGRRSGRAYATPVGAVAADDGFLVALPYGRRPQWLRNVLATGAATLVTEGRTVDVDQPEIVPMEGVEGYFSPGDRRTHRLFGVDECLRLRAAARRPEVVPAEVTAEHAAAA